MLDESGLLDLYIEKHGNNKRKTIQKEKVLH
jgi:hypothetical protein